MDEKNVETPEDATECPRCGAPMVAGGEEWGLCRKCLRPFADGIIKEQREFARGLSLSIAELREENGRLRAEREESQQYRSCMCSKYSEQIDALRLRSSALEAALLSMLDRYTSLVNSGDCGCWDPEGEEPVKAARSLLARNGEAAK